MTKEKILLGAHVSITGGLQNAIYEGERLKCTAIQIFTHSSRQWQIKSISDEQAALFLRAKKESSCVEKIVVHAGYLINIGSSKPDVLKKSRHALIKELQICEQLNITTLVLHPGAYLDGDHGECLLRITESLDEVFKAVPGACKIALESMAGQGTVVGSTFQELQMIRDTVSDKKRLVFCLDTCHLFAAGYDISTPSGYEEVLGLADSIIGLSHIAVWHLNDSEKKCGSRVDRHTHIGKGKLGITPFSLLMNDQRFLAVPKILETPKDYEDDDAKNLALLRSLV